MASTVKANNLYVATSTSGHFAVTIADIRLVNNQVPTPLPNYIASEHIARNYPSTVLFDGGKVWNEPVEVGDPPKSLPVDTWPGAKSGAINSFATAAPGAGSQNVFVSRKKVLCHTHQTEQNARNSFGTIVDKAGLDALLKEYEESLKKQKNEDAKAKSKSDGKGEGKGGKEKKEEKPAKPPPKEPPKAKDCAITGVELLDDHAKGKRRPEPRELAAADAEIQVLAGSHIDLRAIVGEMCGEHPKWACEKTGWTQKGEKASFSVPTGGAIVKSSGLQTLKAFFSDLPNAKPVDYEITVEDHKGKGFRRKVASFPRTSVTPYEVEIPEFNQFGDRVKNVFNQLRLNFLWNITLAKGKVGLEGGWEEEEPGEAEEPKCCCKMSVKGSITLIQGTAELRYSLLNVPIPEPTFQAITKGLKLINVVVEWATGRSLLDLYLFANLTASIATNLALEWKKYYQTPMKKLPGASWDLTGSVTFGLGIRVEALAQDKLGGNALARGEGKGEVGVDVIGKPVWEWPPGIKGSLKIKKPKLSFTLEWDLYAIIIPDEAAGATPSFWRHPILYFQKKWSDYAAAFKEKMIDALGDGALKGSKSWSVEGWWDEKEYELGVWKLPV